LLYQGVQICSLASPIDHGDQERASHNGLVAAILGQRGGMLCPRGGCAIADCVTAYHVGAAGCANVVSSNAICDGTAAARTKHAASLAEDGGDKSVVTGALLISMIDGACK